LFVFALFLASALSLPAPLSPVEKKFRDFIVEFDKPYVPETPEYEYRFTVFQKNVLEAEQKNIRDPFAEWGVTKFSDLTQQEFRDQYLIRDFHAHKAMLQYAPKLEFDDNISDFPAEYDWRNYTTKVLTDVYNQGQCGSCWAFSVTENVESIWALGGNELVSLSMQQVVSCDQRDDGCGGGNPPTAYDYIIGAGGLESYADYPYIGVNGQCRFNSKDVVASIKKWGYITQMDNETAMMAFTYKTGPPSVCVDASTWSSYRGGIITRTSGCGKLIDHCVQIVGWDKTGATPYWIVRNSWGRDWGPYGGYLRVEMGFDVCAIGQEVTSSSLKAV
jgi:cysteine peptidase B